VTRDRVAVPARLSTQDGERWVEVIDTGGIGIVDRHDLGAVVEAQVQRAVQDADVILFVVDVRDGVTPLDGEVARRLRASSVPVLLVCNKVEGTALEWDVPAFEALGVGEGPFAISAQNGTGLGPLYERIGALLPPLEAGEEHAPAPPPPVMKLGVVGQRNAGKSTLINALAGEERMIVSEIPGTTRDAVDVRFERGGRTFVAIDTAGVQKKSRISDAIEFYSDARSYKTIRRADVVVLLFDVEKELSQVDKKLARYVADHYKPVVLGANKWDLIRDHQQREFVEYIRAEMPGVAFAPIVFLSAKTGHGVGRLLETAERLWQDVHERVPTGELNRVLERATEARSPTKDGHRVRIYYATQAETVPPTLVLFVNDKRLLGKDYLRYLTNRLRAERLFEHVPVHIEVRDKQQQKEAE
jgi:GTP-binding protein